MADGRRLGDGSTHTLPAGMRSDRIVVHVVAERTGVARVSDRYVWIGMADGGWATPGTVLPGERWRRCPDRVSEGGG